jgi:hypothetical protein
MTTAEAMAGTRWVRLDVDYFGNPKTLAAGRDGRDLHLASICWTARFLTDGRIPASAVASIAAEAGVTRRAADLVVAAGLWTPNGDGYVLHDFVEMNGSRSAVELDRERWRERQRRYRASRVTDA